MTSTVTARAVRSIHGSSLHEQQHDGDDEAHADGEAAEGDGHEHRERDAGRPREGRAGEHEVDEHEADGDEGRPGAVAAPDRAGQRRRRSPARPRGRA